jgi:hypothetical protein
MAARCDGSSAKGQSVMGQVFDFDSRVGAGVSWNFHVAQLLKQRKTTQRAEFNGSNYCGVSTSLLRILNGKKGHCGND